LNNCTYWESWIPRGARIHIVRRLITLLCIGVLLTIKQVFVEIERE